MNYFCFSGTLVYPKVLYEKSHMFSYDVGLFAYAHGWVFIM